MNLVLNLNNHLVQIGDREKVSVSDDDAVKGIMPYPLLREDNQVWCQHHNRHQVKMRLVITDDDSRFPEILFLGILIGERCARDMMNDELGILL